MKNFSIREASTIAEHEQQNMSKSPTVSVLMPVYNAEKYVAEAVESILGQTFTDFEFLIVDDGSSDDSLAILKRYAKKDQRIRLVSQQNKGLIQTLNEMLSRSEGEFIARMDADDIALPERFARQVEFLQRESSVVFVGGSLELIDEKSRSLTYIEAPEHDAQIQQLLLVGHNCICHPSAMIRRAALIKVGGYDELMQPGTEDLDLWLRLGEVGVLANLKDTLVKYRLHGNSVSGRDRTQQITKAQEACDRAWQRRGIKGSFAANAYIDTLRPGTDRSSRHHFMLMYGWWAFNFGQRKTAVIYGIKAISALPFAVEGWKLLVCAAIKPLPRPDSK